MMESTLADMLDPHFWTVNHMIVAFIILIMAGVAVKSVFTE